MAMKLAGIQKALRRRPAVAAALVALPALLVYLRTMAPGIVFGDSPELTTAAYVAGVAHPTGYPLYMMLGWLYTHLIPFGTVAWRMNLLSVTAATVGVALLYLLALRIVRNRIASVATALLLAFSLTFWSRAIIAEAYVMHLTLVVAVLLCVVSWDRTGNRRWLLAGAFVWGLSFTHHLQTMLLAPALLYYIITSRRRAQFVRELRWTVPLFLLPLLLYLYLPLSTLWQPLWTSADASTWPGFRDHVSGAIYRHFMGVHSGHELWQRVQDYAGALIHDDNRGRRDRPAYLLSEFSLSLLWLAPVGVYGLWRRQRRLFGLTVLFYGAVVAWALNYTIQNVEVYYIPSHMIVAIWIGCGLRQLGAALALVLRRIRVRTASRRRIVLVYASGLLALPLLLVPANLDANDLHGVRTVENVGRALLTSLKPNALLLASGDDWVFPALYPHYVEGCRQDVTVLPVFWFSVSSDLTLINHTLFLRTWIDSLRPVTDLRTVAARWESMRRVIIESRMARPVYLAGPLATHLAAQPELRAAIPGLRYVAGREPVYEIVERDQATVDLRRPQAAIAVSARDTKP